MTFRCGFGSHSAGYGQADRQRAGLFGPPAHSAGYVAGRPLSIVSLDPRINRIGRAIERVGDLIGCISRSWFSSLDVHRLAGGFDALMAITFCDAKLIG